MFWPSFNSVLVDVHPAGRKLRAVLSTYLALAVSAVTAAAVSVLSSPEGKLNLVLWIVLNHQYTTKKTKAINLLLRK